VDAIVVVVAAAGPPIVIGIVADETGAGEEAGQVLGHPNAAHPSSLKTSKWTMIWHYSFYYRKASK
jgi:hypothetical protein